MQSFLRSQYHKLGLAMMIVLLLSLVILTAGGRAGSEHQTIPTAPPPTATDTSEEATEVPTNPTQQTVIAPLPTSVQPSQTEEGSAIATVGAVPASQSSEPSATIEPIGATIRVFTGTPLTPLATGGTPSATALATLTEEGQESGLTTSQALCVIGVGAGLVMLVIGLGWLRRRRES
jgi:cobalamin biosynthesis Mg chelatase CobN